MLPKPFDDQPSRITETKAATTFGFLVAANIAAWIWALIAFADRPGPTRNSSLSLHVRASARFRRRPHCGHRQCRSQAYAGWQVALFSRLFTFALGHSSIVVLTSIAIAADGGSYARESSTHSTTLGGVIGTKRIRTVSSGLLASQIFLILKSVWSAFGRARRGEKIIDDDLDCSLGRRGLLAGVFRPLFRVVSKSWHMYPIGFLFGLGFDTATEIGLLGISATQAAQGMSFLTILVFPALFTAGMSLIDTTDSVLMTGAYGWAFVNPIRKLWYNLTTTAASVVVALFIGGVEALGLIGDKLGLEGGLSRVIGGLNNNLANFGFAVVGIFIASWIVSALVYRAKGFDNLEVRLS